MNRRYDSGDGIRSRPEHLTKSKTHSEQMQFHEMLDCVLSGLLRYAREKWSTKKIKTLLCNPWEASHTVSFTGETQTWSISAPLHWVEYSSKTHAASPFCPSRLMVSQTIQSVKKTKNNHSLKIVSGCLPLWQQLGGWIIMGQNVKERQYLSI